MAARKTNTARTTKPKKTTADAPRARRPRASTPRAVPPVLPPTTLGAEPARAISAEPAEEPVYRLDELHARTGPATMDDVLAFVEGHTPLRLIEEGRGVATDRIDTDAARLYGFALDFLHRATDAQRAAVPALSPKFLRVAIHAAAQGSVLSDAREAALAKRGTARDTRAVDAEATHTQGLARRGQLRNALRVFAAGDAKLRVQIDAAYGTSSTPKELATSIRELVKVGRGMLREPTPAMKARLEGTRFTLAWLDEADALADDVEEAGELGAAPMAAAEIQQTDVDHWDGVNLVMLGQLIDTFEVGHAADPTVPRLVPIALRSYFKPARPAKKEEEGAKPKEPAAPVTP